jgi:hypothetical protein
VRREVRSSRVNLRTGLIRVVRTRASNEDAVHSNKDPGLDTLLRNAAPANRAGAE